MKSVCLWIVIAVVVLQSTSSVQDFPKHENIFFIIDVDKSLADTAFSILKQLWGGVDLLKYRIAVYTTNGVVIKISEFQSKECCIVNLASKSQQNRTLTRQEVLQKVIEEAGLFKDEHSTSKSVAVLITDDDLVSRKFHYVIRIPDDVIGDMLDMEIIRNWHFHKDSVTTCNSHSPKQKVIDQCLRECDCHAGKLTNCYRVRQQYSKLTLQERLYYIKAYKTLYKHKAFQQRFRDLLSVHGKLKFRELHGKNQILPFHRKYLLVVENLFQLLDCRITIPYWHFPLHYRHLFRPAPNYHIWDAVGGFGSTETDPENGFCVSDGPFAYPGWKIPPEASTLMENKTLIKWVCNNKYGYSRWLENQCNSEFDHTLNRRCLSRAVNEDKDFKLITYQEIKDLITNTTIETYDKFLLDIIFKVHSPVHDKLGGILCTGLSSYAPEFFPFHSMLDAVWDKWQSKEQILQEKSLFYNHTIPLLWFKEKREKYVDNTNLGECGVKVKYTEIFFDDEDIG